MKNPILELSCATIGPGKNQLFTRTVKVNCHIHSGNVFFEFPEGDGFSVRKEELLAILSAMGGGKIITDEAQIKGMVYDAIASLFNQISKDNE